MPAEKASVRFLKILEKLGAGWFAPWQIRRTARAQIDVEHERHLTLAQAEQDVKAIESGRKRLVGGRLIDVEETGEELSLGLPVEATVSLAGVAERNVAARHMRGEVNVAKALLHAEAAALEDDDQSAPDREVDDDWLYRWRDSASTVSNEKLQDLWGRALAGEVKSPGTFSLRTLEFLKNLSQQEAQLIEKLAPFAIDGSYACSDQGDADVAAHGITYTEILELDDLGVITRSSSSSSGLYMTRRIPSQGSGLQSHNRLLLVVPVSGEEATLDLPAHRLTPVGSQVLKLGSFTANETYLRGVGEAIKSKGFRVSIARCVRLTETEVKFFDEEEL